MYFASHSAIAPFRLHRPPSAAEAARLLGQLPNAVLLAGGVDLVPRLRNGMEVGDVIALDHAADLRRIEHNGTSITVGGAVTFDQFASSDLLANHLPAFSRAVAEQANIRVRCTATVGGNLAAANPGYDLLPLLIAADAKIKVLRSGGETTWEMAAGLADWAPDGIIAALDIPIHDGFRLHMERRFKPVVSVFSGMWADDGGVFGAAAIGCAFDKIWNVTLPPGRASAGDVAAKADAIAAEMTGDMPSPIDDSIASSIYRSRLIRTLLKRHLERLGS